MIWAHFDPSLPHVSISEHFNTPSLMLTWAFSNFEPPPDMYLILKPFSSAIRSISWFCSCKKFNWAVPIVPLTKKLVYLQGNFQSVLGVVFFVFNKSKLLDKCASASLVFEMLMWAIQIYPPPQHEHPWAFGNPLPPLPCSRSLWTTPMAKSSRKSALVTLADKNGSWDLVHPVTLYQFLFVSLSSKQGRRNEFELTGAKNR